MQGKIKTNLRDWEGKKDTKLFSFHTNTYRMSLFYIYPPIDTPAQDRADSSALSASFSPSCLDHIPS